VQAGGFAARLRAEDHIARRVVLRVFPTARDAGDFVCRVDGAVLRSAVIVERSKVALPVERPGLIEAVGAVGGDQPVKAVSIISQRHCLLCQKQ